MPTMADPGAAPDEFHPLGVDTLAAVLVLSCPMPGRGPRLFQRADPWRLFKFEARRLVMPRAGHRCGCQRR